MTFNRCSDIGIACVLLFVAGTAAAPAQAADAAALAVPTANWSGVYIGPHVGYAWTDASYRTNHVNRCNTLSTPFAEPCDPVNANPAGLVAGGQIGARWQAGAWVLGVEGAWTAANLNQRTASVLSDTLEYYTQLRDIYTVTAQVGYAWNSVLTYVKGGYAGGHFALNSYFIAPFAADAIPASATGKGWTVGGGAEFSLTPNLSVGLEYNHIHLDAGSASVCASPDTQLIFNCTLPVFITKLQYADIRNNIDQVMFRANYRFNWLGGSGAAKR